MLSPAREHSDLFARIDRWRQAVTSETLQRGDTRAQRLQIYQSSHMKLRPRPTRPALVEASGNPVRKHKISATEAVASTTKKRKMDKDEQPRPLRSTKGKIPETAGQFDLPTRPASVPALASIPGLQPSSRSASPSKRTTSPSKKGQLLTTITPDTAIDMAYLRRCDPAVIQTTFSDLRLAGQQVSSSVHELHEKLWNTPLGFVPAALKHAYTQDTNTPRKSKPSIPEAWYLDDAKTPFPKRCLDRMKDTVESVLEKAETAHSDNAHERQWGNVVSQLLDEVEIWQKSPRAITVINVESCSIGPAEFRVRKPDGAARIDDSTSSKSKTPSEDIGRMVDWCLAVKLDMYTKKLITDGYKNSADNECGLNQSLSYIRNKPLILDIEIKKTLQLRDPEVQLAIWAGSGLLKKRYHGWDTSMPSPAIVVSGHSWKYYIFFEMDDDLMMAGPYPFGTTDSLNGIWSILYRLHLIMKWGTTEYKVWFEEEVVKSVREGRFSQQN